MAGLKMSVQSKAWFCHRLEHKVSRFIVAAFSVFFNKALFNCDDSPVVTFRTNVENHKQSHRESGSCKLYQHVACGAPQFMVDHRTFQNRILSGVYVHLWKPPKKPISDLYNCSLYMGKKKVLFWGIYERMFTCSLITHVHTTLDRYISDTF